jgi:hypothetical protein
VARDWAQWHREYDEPDSRLARRLAIVQARICDALDACRPGPIRVISMCAGQGRDLLGVLATHPRASDVQARLVELEADLAPAPRPGIEVVVGDAADTSAYADAVPADVVLVCGVFGNVSDHDIRHTVKTLPSLCAPAAFVIWTRHRIAPDLTVDIRQWFTESGFDEIAFDGSDDFLFGVGMNRLARAPDPYESGITLFTFR